MNSLIDFLSSENIEFLQDASMKKYTSFKIGGNASVICFVKTEKQLEALLSYLYKRNIKPFILGNGSNILVSDKGIDGVVIKLQGDFQEISHDGEYLTAGAGALLSSLCKYALSKKLSGLEFAYGIPGTVGGAAYMNAGAYGGQMSDVTLKVSHFNADGTKGFYEGSDLDFAYRHSVYSNSNKVITHVSLKLQNGDENEIKDKMNDFLSRRKDKQPLNLPSAGSVFKRPEGYFAGALIEQSGLKGKTVGGAMVSEKHAGFIVNAGNATADDVLSLIKLCQSTVKDKFGVLLECEIKTV